VVVGGAGSRVADTHLCAPVVVAAPGRGRGLQLQGTGGRPGRERGMVAEADSYGVPGWGVCVGRPATSLCYSTLIFVLFASTYIQQLTGCLLACLLWIGSSISLQKKRKLLLLYQHTRTVYGKGFFGKDRARNWKKYSYYYSSCIIPGWCVCGVGVRGK
jgi:hypothetical protein